MIKAKGCVPRARLGDRGRPSAGAGMSREHAGGDAKLLIKFAWPYRTTLARSVLRTSVAGSD